MTEVSRRPLRPKATIFLRRHGPETDVLRYSKPALRMPSINLAIAVAV